jgi:hypothetical protein
VIDPGLFLGDAAGPEPLDEDANAIPGEHRLVDTLEL